MALEAFASAADVSGVTTALGVGAADVGGAAATALSTTDVSTFVALGGIVACFSLVGRTLLCDIFASPFGGAADVAEARIGAGSLLVGTVDLCEIFGSIFGRAAAAAESMAVVSAFEAVAAICNFVLSG